MGDTCETKQEHALTSAGLGRQCNKTKEKAGFLSILKYLFIANEIVLFCSNNIESLSWGIQYVVSTLWYHKLDYTVEHDQMN